MVVSKKHKINDLIWNFGIVYSFVSFLGFFLSKHSISFGFGIPIAIYCLYRIKKNNSVQWILEDEVLTYKSGLFSWNKTNFQIDIDTIYEAYYKFGFFSNLFGYADLFIKRTDGISTTYTEKRMTNAADLISKVNNLISENRKKTKLPNQSNTQINNFYSQNSTDELYRLSELLNKGLINQNEFDEQKTKILKG